MLVYTAFVFGLGFVCGGIAAAVYHWWISDHIRPEDEPGLH